MLLSIDKLAVGGEGVAREASGRVVFVQGAAPGDQVHVTLTEAKRSYARARIDALVTAGPCRVAPLCPLVERCGGCQWQHINYEAQQQAKHEALKSALRKLPTVGDVTFAAAPGPFHYRRRARFHWVVDDNGQLYLGYRERRGRRIVDVESCPILMTGLVASLGWFRRRLAGGPPGAGTLSLLAGLQGVHASLRVVRGPLPPAEQLFDEHLSGMVAESSSGATWAVGASEIPIDSTGLLAAADAFCQANPEQDLLLRAEVARLVAADSGAGQMLELHAGVGTLSRSLLAHARHLTAVELNSQAVRLLRLNASGPGVGTASIVEGDACEAVRAWSAPLDTLVVDPPREGCGKDLIAAIAALAPRNLVYVSCDPMTMARDLTQLGLAGFGGLQVHGIDMMPQTFHVEAVARMCWGEAG